MLGRAEGKYDVVVVGGGPLAWARRSARATRARNGC